MLLVSSFVLLLLHVYQKKKYESSRMVGLFSVQVIIFTLSYFSDAIASEECIFHFHLFSIVVFFCLPDLSTECCYLFIVIYLNARARYRKTEAGRERETEKWSGHVARQT